MRTAMAMTAAAVVVLAAGAAGARGWHDDFTPRDPVVNQAGHVEWNWDGKDALGLEAPVTLHYTPQGAPRVVATGPEEMLSHLQFGQGRIRMERDWHNSGSGRIDVTVTGVTVHNIALSGSGRAELSKLDLDRLHLAISGSGSVTGDGRADQVDVALSGSGKADLSHLAVRDANIHISGSGRVEISPSDSVNLAASGSGTVHMARRPPHVNQSISGSGGVRIDGG